MSFTLAEMNQKVRQRANMENSTFISDDEIKGYINGSYAELYDLLVGQFEDYFSTEHAFTISSGNTQSLPSDLYKVRGLDVLISGNDYGTCRRWNFEERNRIAQTRIRAMDGSNSRLYRVMGQSIIVLPEDKGPGQYKLWYIPRFTPLVSQYDVIGDVLDFEEYIVVDAAMKCLIKEESSINELMVVKQQLKSRINSMAANRDTQAERVADVSSDSDYLLFPRGY